MNKGLLRLGDFYQLSYPLACLDARRWCRAGGPIALYAPARLFEGEHQCWDNWYERLR